MCYFFGTFSQLWSYHSRIHSKNNGIQTLWAPKQVPKSDKKNKIFNEVANKLNKNCKKYSS